MAKGNNQKLKLLYLARILQEKTDDEHWLTLPQIQDELNRYQISSERKSLYSDFEALRQFGLDIIKEKEGLNFYYHMGKRDMEMAELKLLVDAVQSSKFITEKKSRQLIKKLEKNVSRYEAKQLNRQVFVHGRVKTMNESIYYNVDKIHYAIENNIQIQFQYFQWNVNKVMELRRSGAFYRISPWELMWNDHNYYLVGYDNESDRIKHFRVDKMKKIKLTEDEREGKNIFSQMDIVSYANKRFGMYDGEERNVQLLFDNQLAGVVLDRFGKDVRMYPKDSQHFQVSVDVAVSSQFFGWVMALGTGVKILGPEDVVLQMQDEVGKLSQMYRNDNYFASVVEQDLCAVVICNLEHEIVYMNPAAIDNYSKRGGMELIGKNLLDCHAESSRERIKQIVEWFEASPENNIIYTYYDVKKNKDVYMVALRHRGELIGYYEKHEFRNRETRKPYER